MNSRVICIRGSFLIIRCINERDRKSICVQADEFFMILRFGGLLSVSS